ncbi:cysteine--tRNA ligase [bacterium BMS3Abin05]|nr:cysteine--tRNA ligase [bacterium BMS3Abin05]GBE26682.1 cysteine--tRNA ligase [bacterium BMS3Bbin03]HDK36049.1 cysteine--tRNA ligase [Bacteroidota bacterium]HDZ10683.1 cysteine--tRNA ligase [Bacteroidota bacterium]
MSLKVYNTLTKRKEDFVPQEPGKVRFYACGPTVYDYFHIGNARPFVVFDVFRRFLMYRGYQVIYAVNITDVDDKIIKKANNEGVSIREVTQRYARAYLEDIYKLRILPPDVNPRATAHIDEMIELIRKLFENGYAYEVDGDVYYDVGRFKDYGKLSGKKIDELQSGARIEVDERKHNPLDFALWKSARPDEPWWESPWGNGRPGWHIECSTMSMKYLGSTLDIHAGGEDLIFPHHENEIAQSEAATGKPFARYWMHNGFLQIRGEKMSKSLGNFLTAREVVKRHKPEAVRLFFLQKHYRSPINYSEEILSETENALMRLKHVLENIERTLEGKKLSEIEEKDLTGPEKQRWESLQKNRLRFIQEMEDDFNTAGAVGQLFEMAKIANRILEEEELSENNQKILKFIHRTFHEFDSFLSLFGAEEETGVETGTFNQLVNILVQIRNDLRAKKEWALADEIRNKLMESGILIEDRKDGTSWKPVKKNKNN